MMRDRRAETASIDGPASDHAQLRHFIRSIPGIVSDPRGRLPDFVCLGAQKAGTTTFFEVLRRHPQAFLPAEKEVHYFTHHFDRPESWYRERFEGARPGQRAGDVTPYYLFHPAVPARIRAMLPQAQLIALVRDPVARAISGYFHERRRGTEPLTIEAAFAAEDERLRGAEDALARPGHRHRAHQECSYVARSRYELQLARYLELFPRSQLLVVRSEDLFAGRDGAWPRVLDFLGLAHAPLAGAIPRSNGGNGEAAGVDAGFRRELRARLEPTYAAMRRDWGIAWDDARDERRDDL